MPIPMSQALIDTVTALKDYVATINNYSYELLDASRADLLSAIEVYQAAIQNECKVVTII